MYGWWFPLLVNATTLKRSRVPPGMPGDPDGMPGTAIPRILGRSGHIFRIASTGTWPSTT